MKYVFVENVQMGERDKDGAPIVHKIGSEFKGSAKDQKRLIDEGLIVPAKEYAKIVKSGKQGADSMAARIEELEQENARLRDMLEEAGVEMDEEDEDEDDSEEEKSEDSEDESDEEDAVGEDELMAMKKEELLGIAKQVGAEFNSKSSKEELVEAILAAEAGE